MAEDSVRLLIVRTGDILSAFSSYSYKSEFLTPTDRWTIETSDTRTVQHILAVLKPGDDIQLQLRGFPVCTGPLGKISLKMTTTGLQATLSGRDRLARAVDAGVDPLLVWTSSQTMGDVFQAIFAPLGFDKLSTSDIFNRYAMSGINPAKAGTHVLEAAYDKPDTIPEQVGTIVYDKPTGTYTHQPAVTELFDPTRPASMKTLTMDQFKPAPESGVFEFWSKLIKRFGLWSWCSGDGEYVVTDAPDFTQAPSYTFTLRLDGKGNNIEESSWEIDGENQPSVILGTAFGGGGFHDVNTLKVAAVNELTGCDVDGNILPQVRALIDKYKGAHVLPLRQHLFGFSENYTNTIARPAYLHDDESKNLGQLSAVIRRKLAECQKRGLTYKITVRDHSQDGKPFMVNTMANVFDETLGVSEPMWIMEREFIRSNEGSKTHLTLIRAGSLDLIV